VFNIRKAILTTFLLLVSAGSIGAGKTPSEAFLEYHSVLKRSFNVEAIWAYHVRSARQEFEDQFPPQMRGRAFHIMKSSAPAVVRVENETIEGDVAMLKLGLADGSHRVTTGSTSVAVSGEAVMRREDGAWKVEKVVWQVQ
jgi:hypothetical protein